MSKQSSFVPNSFQTPNAFVDYVMPYLSGEEYKVLVYATRRILGFQKRQDRISLSQFTKGTKNKKGKILDRGTGLSIETVKKALVTLVAFGLMVKVDKNDPKTNEGVLWSLQWNGRKVQWKALEEREEKKSSFYSERMAKARSMRQTPPNGIEGGSPNDIESPPPCGIETQYTEEIQGKPEEDDAEAIKARTAELSTLYETNIGPITSLMADFIRNAAITYPQAWYEPAFAISVKNNARKWSYVEAVLEGWQKNGFGWSPAHNGNGHKRAQKPAGPEPKQFSQEEIDRQRALWGQG